VETYPVETKAGFHAEKERVRIARKTHSPEQVIGKLTEVEVLFSKGQVPVRRAGPLARLRSSQRHRQNVPQDERRPIAEMHRLALRWPRFGCRRIAALLPRDGWWVNVKRAHRL